MNERRYIYDYCTLLFKVVLMFSAYFFFLLEFFTTDLYNVHQPFQMLVSESLELLELSSNELVVDADIETEFNFWDLIFVECLVHNCVVQKNIFFIYSNLNF